MSYMFTAILYKNGQFDEQAVGQAIQETEAKFPIPHPHLQESYVKVGGSVMHVSIMKLAIPCDWEVLLNRFYDLPSDELPVKPDSLGEGVEYSFSLFYAKCGRHQITVD